VRRICNKTACGRFDSPRYLISGDKSSLSANQTATLTFTLSESVSDFVLDDITVSGGTLSKFSGSGTNYSATFTPRANSTAQGIVSVASNKFSDAAGNFNVDGADANNTVTLTVNTVQTPTVGWIRLFGESYYDIPNSVAIGRDGAIYLAGQTDSRTLEGQTTHGGRDGFITRYNSDGIKVWTRLVGGLGDDAAESVSTGADGGIYVAGYTNSRTLDGQTNNGSTNGFICRYNSDGTKVWTELLGGVDLDYLDGASASASVISVSGWVESIAIGAGGAVYAAGREDNGNPDGYGQPDGFISRYSTGGSKAWAARVGGTGYEDEFRVASGPDGAVYVVGQTDSYTVDGQTGHGGRDGFITRFNSDGTKVWTRILGGTGDDYTTSVTVGRDGTIYVAGYTDSRTFDGQTSHGSRDGFITRYNSDGIKAWTRLVGGSGGDYQFSVTAGVDGAVYVAGLTESTTFNGQTSHGRQDGFVARYNSDGTEIWTRLVGAAGYDNVTGVTVGADGSIYVVGHSFSVDSKGAPFDTYMFLIKLDSTGSTGSTSLVPTGTVSITGTTRLGQTLGVTAAISDADVMGTISYQWMADSQVIDGAVGSSLTLTQAQFGKTVTVVASYTDLLGNPKSIFSNALQVAGYSTAALENSKTVTTLGVVDALLGTAPKYTLSGLDAGLFKVSSKGVLTFAAVKDYEQPVDANKDGIYEVSVTLTNTKTGYKVVRDLTVGVEFVPINGTAGADTIKGTAGWDTLDGLGGDDKLTGGTGLDTFLVTSGYDKILDFNALTRGATGSEILQVSAGATADATLKSAWVATVDSFNQGAANLTTSGLGVDLSAISQGLGWNVTNKGKAATLTGTRFNDTITGGTGNDTLIGGAGNDVLAGGKGSDALTGGGGSVIFRLGGDTKTDRITDFLSGTDRIELGSLVFKALPKGDLPSSQFVLGTKALTPTQHVIYDKASSNLWYDADGSGKGAAILIGVLENKPDLIFGDFTVI